MDTTPDELVTSKNSGMIRVVMSEIEAASEPYTIGGILNQAKFVCDAHQMVSLRSVDCLSTKLS